MGTGNQRTPDVEAIVKRYDPHSNGSNALQPHPFAGEYTRLKEPIVIRDGRVPCDIATLCRTAKAQKVITYAFIDGHRYELTSLKDVMSLDSAVKAQGEGEARCPKVVRLKAKGHGAASIDALTNVYHAFISDPESPVEVVENGDSDECQE